MTGNTTETRDHELGTLLRSLDTPEHGPGFDEALHSRFADEAAAGRRQAAHRWAVRAAVIGIAAAAAITIVAVGIPGTSKTPPVGGPSSATAATVRAAVRAAYDALQNMSGTLTADGKRWSFTLDSSGDLRLEGATTGELITYDSQLGEARSAQRSASLSAGTLFYADRTGVAPGEPDQGPPTWILPEQFGAFVRAALAARDPRVTETTFQGRAAWRMDVPIEPNTIVPEASGDHFTIAVDQETGMPVQIVELKGAKPLHELTIGGLAVNQPLARDLFQLTFPAGADVARTDDGFKRVALASVAEAVGYEPLVPTDVPAGYRLQEVAVARDAIRNALGRPSQMVVSLRYGRGLDDFIITMRKRVGDSSGDPFAIPGITSAPETTRVQGGALAGAEANLVVAPTEPPHLWALTDRLLVTVSGDLDASQLTAAAGSLRPRTQ
jgi:hypothetical protein